MPFIHIRSLPLGEKADIPRVLRKVSSRFAADTGVAERHITVTWEYFPSGHYLFGAQSGAAFDARRHQILVELLVPDFNAEETAAQMMRSIALALTQTLNLPNKCIFIHCRYAHANRVMEGTEVVQW